MLDLQFGAKSIQVSGAGAGSDVPNSAREIAHHIGKCLEHERIVQQIAAGAAGG